MLMILTMATSEETVNRQIDLEVLHSMSTFHKIPKICVVIFGTVGSIESPRCELQGVPIPAGFVSV